MMSNFEKNILKIKKQIFKNFIDEIIFNYQALLTAAKNNDEQELKNVINFDKKLDEIYNDNYDACVWIIAREHPFASDLRNIISILFINRELERVADSTKNVAKSMLFYKDSIAPSKYLKYLEMILNSIINQLKALQKVNNNTNMDFILDIANRDVVIDKIYHKQTMEIIKNIHNSKSIPETKSLSSIFITLKNLERAGDHIVDILEEHIYFKKGLHYGL